MTIFLGSLVAVMLGPLVLLGVYMAADALKLPIAERILAATVQVLTLQWFVGGVVNVLGGLVIAGLGVWGSLHFTGMPYRLASLVLVPAGLWRTWRGAMILSDFGKKKEGQPEPAKDRPRSRS
jgi:hypothetical protein